MPTEHLFSWRLIRSLMPTKQSDALTLPTTTWPCSLPDRGCGGDDCAVSHFCQYKYSSSSPILSLPHLPAPPPPWHMFHPYQKPHRSGWLDSSPTLRVFVSRGQWLTATMGCLHWCLPAPLDLQALSPCRLRRREGQEHGIGGGGWGAARWRGLNMYM